MGVTFLPSAWAHKFSVLRYRRVRHSGRSSLTKIIREAMEVTGPWMLTFLLFRSPSLPIKCDRRTDQRNKFPLILFPRFLLAKANCLLGKGCFFLGNFYFKQSFQICCIHLSETLASHKYWLIASCHRPDLYRLKIGDEKRIYYKGRKWMGRNKEMEWVNVYVQSSVWGKAVGVGSKVG